MEIQLPQTTAELLPFSAAAATLLFGLFAMFTPRLMLRAFTIHAMNQQPQGVAEMRATLGGFYVGIGLLSLLLFDQQNIQLLLGGAWTFATFGRLVALLSDGVSRWANTVLLFLSLAIAAASLASGFGMVHS
ncbi:MULTISPECIES: DUF4345 family protein [unclassified Aureimonas]|uniref:AGROH133_08824 family phage infection protein n=1 Tax=unclassified Aureimonas TaxID=2615206 RepID=UPI0006FE0C26|nr:MULTISPECIES: DUF4345 family protein [unclassified Aureimonas]KQT66011.1 hypothetical protein ASG62_21095 [Aureimonas sp. Leaf427]KQT73369.1 hypothetical protein ASG54_17575 [Aureimonas sp. Leaf460]